MLHSRPDYMRIQDPSSLIPQDEPVFLLRAQDKTAALVVEVWAAMQPDGPLALMAKKHAEAMRVWEDAHPARMKWADITPDQRSEVHGPHPIGGWKPLPNAPVGGVVRDLERRLEAMSLSHAGRIAELERCKNELDDLKRQHYRLQRSFDTERAACNEHVLTIGNMRLSATSAGCVELEVCSDCGSPADGSGCNPCKLPFTERRLVNRRAEGAERERDERELENFHLREKLKSWETLMPCGHPEAALMVDDPPHCAVCDREARITDQKRRLEEVGRILQRAARETHELCTDKAVSRYVGGTHADH